MSTSVNPGWLIMVVQKKWKIAYVLKWHPN